MHLGPHPLYERHQAVVGVPEAGHWQAVIFQVGRRERQHASQRPAQQPGPPHCPVQPCDGVSCSIPITVEQRIPSPARTDGNVLGPGQCQQGHGVVASHRSPRRLRGVSLAGPMVVRIVNDGRPRLDYDITLQRAT